MAAKHNAHGSLRARPRRSELAEEDVGVYEEDSGASTRFAISHLPVPPLVVATVPDVVALTDPSCGLHVYQWQRGW